jgi:hypothetical protein
MLEFERQNGVKTYESILYPDVNTIQDTASIGYMSLHRVIRAP